MISDAELKHYNSQKFIKIGNAYLTLQNIELSFIFFAASRPDDVIKNLISELTKEQAKPNPSLRKQHIIISFLKRFGSDISYGSLNYMLAVNSLRKEDNALFNALNVYMSIESLSKSQLSDSLYCLNNILTKHSSLLSALLHELQPLIEIISPGVLFLSFGINGISFYEKIPMEYLENNTFKIRTFTSCFSLPQNYCYTEFSIFIQNRIISKFKFPLAFPQTPQNESHALSLTGSSVSDNLHFIDCLKNGIEILWKEKDYDLITNLFSINNGLSCLQEFLPWLIIALGKTILNNYIFLKKIIKVCLYYKKDKVEMPISFRLINRIFSDMKLINYASKHHNQKLNTLDIKSHSIPYLFVNNFSSKYIFKLSHKFFYNIDDDEREIDFDFIRASNSISAFIELLLLHSSDFSKNNKEDIIFNSIQQCINKISNKELRETIVMDLFSLIFLRYNCEFVCSPTFALWLLNILFLFSKNEYIMRAQFIMTSLSRKLSFNCSLSEYIISDLSAFVLALDSKNWENAKLIAKNDKKLFILYEVARKFENELLNISEESMKLYEIECSMTKYTISEATNKDEIENVFVNLLCQDRKKEMEKNYILKNLIEIVKKPLEEVTKEEIDQSKSCFYLSKFFKMLFIFSEGDLSHIPSNTIISFLQKNQIQKAIELSKSFDFDLFSIILTQEKEIPITKEIIMEFSPQFPFECFVLFTFNYMNIKSCIIGKSADKKKDNEPENISDLENVIYKRIPNNKYLRRFNFKNYLLNEIFQEDFEERIIYEFENLMISKECNFTLFDDILFRIEPDNLAKLIKQSYLKYRMKQLAFVYDFIKEDIPDLFIIVSSFKESSYSISNITVEEYIQNLPEQIPKLVDNMALSDILSLLQSQYITPSNIFQITDCLVKKYFDSFFSVSLIVSSFPDYFFNIFKAAKLLDHSIDQMFLKLCPSKSIKKQIKALILLPPQILFKTDFSNLKESIFFNLSSNPCLIILIKNNILSLINSDFVVSLISIDVTSNATMSSIKVFQKHVIYFALEFPQIIHEITNIVVASMIPLISNLTISSLSSERMALKLFRILSSLPIEVSSLNKYLLLYQFVSLLLFDHKSSMYSFNDFPSSIFASKIISLCFINDYPNLGLQIGLEFNTPIYENARILMQNSFYLGVSGTARFWASHAQIDENSLMKNFICCPVFDQTSLNAIMNTQIYLLSRGNIAPFNYYHRLKAYSRGFLMNDKTENISELQYYITNFFQPVSRSIALLVKHDCYDLALTLLTSIYDANHLIDCFVNSFIFIAVSYSKLDEVQNYLYRTDPGMSFTLPFWEGLFGYLNKCQMKKSLVLFYKHINALETASQICEEMLLNDCSDDESEVIKYINQMEILLSDSLEIRKGSTTIRGEGEYPFRPSEMNVENISKLLSKIKIQKSVINFYINKNKMDVKIDELIFMRNENYAISAASILLMNCEVDLAFNIVSVSNISKKKVILNASKHFINEPFSIIHCFFNSLNKKYSTIFNELLEYFLQCFVELGMDSQIVQQVIGFETDNERSMCLFYLEYCFLDEAYSSAKVNRLFDIIPLIALKSSNIGKVDIVHLCEKSLIG